MDEQRKMNEANTEEDFDAFLKGEKAKNRITDDMTLQDIFKQYYNKAHSIDIKQSNIVNSAMSSINSFSSRLEKRR